MAISSLNPHAPLFVPAAFLAAEDFSPDWWRLVHTCPAFREYWIKERSDCYQDPELASDFDLELDLCLDFDLDCAFDSDLDGSFLSDDDEFEDPTSPLVNPALHDCSYSLPVLKQEENIPPARLLPRALNVDVHAFAAKADLRELATSKQRKQQFSPPSSREKVSQIVTVHHMKSSPRKIQQPR